MRHNIYFDRI